VLAGRHDWNRLPAPSSSLLAADSPRCGYDSFPALAGFRRGARIVASTDAGIDNVPHHGFVGSLLARARADNLRREAGKDWVMKLSGAQR